MISHFILFAIAFSIFSIVHAQNNTHQFQAVSSTGTHSEKEIIRGVNIGGWLVLEPFLRPSLFDQFRRGGWNDSYYLADDEWTFCQQLGPEEASRQLHSHWDNWLIENDLKLLAEAGITHIRIPIGYWSIVDDPDAPYVSGALPYMMRAFEWCRRYGLKVWVDLHGAPGSQNGWNHSGRLGPALMFQEDNVVKTLEILRKLYRIISVPQYKDIVVGLEVLNEPGFTIDVQTIKSFYLRAYKMLREEEGATMALGFSDSFRGALFEGFFEENNMTNCYIDQHTYFIFSLGQLNRPRSVKIDQDVCGAAKQAVIHAEKTTGSVITGEWSLADTDCTPAVNNLNKGARWDGTLGTNPPLGSCTGDYGVNQYEWSQEYKEWLRNYFLGQMESYESGHGWFFWSFKAEMPGAVHWNYLAGIQGGWIPSNLKNVTKYCKI